MKKALLAFSLLFATSAQASMCSTEIEINGMVCDFCATSLEKVLSKEQSVAAVNVDLSTQTVYISYKGGMRPIEETKLKELVRKAGNDYVKQTLSCPDVL